MEDDQRRQLAVLARVAFNKDEKGDNKDMVDILAEMPAQEL